MGEPYKVGTKLWHAGPDGKPVECAILAVLYELDVSQIGGTFGSEGSFDQDELQQFGFHETPYELQKARRAEVEATIAECQAELSSLIASTDEA